MAIHINLDFISRAKLKSSYATLNINVYVIVAFN